MPGRMEFNLSLSRQAAPRISNREPMRLLVLGDFSGQPAVARKPLAGTYRALVNRWRKQPGGQGWALITGLFSFRPSVQDIGLLAALGVLASQAGGPLLAAGDPALAGDDGPALAGWHSLRQSEVAPWIGLAAPRPRLHGPGLGLRAR